MDIREPLYITTIAREKNLSAAGKKLSVSQPSLSSFLNKLEDELGENLFYRDKKQLYPTAAGKIYLEAAGKILRIYDQMNLSIRQLQNPFVETITIAATPLRGSIMFANVYPLFSRKFPNVRLELRESYTSNILEMLRAGSADLSFASFPDLENPYFDYIRFFTEEVVLAVPSFHKMAPLASRDPGHPTAVSIEAFSDDSFLLMSPGSTIRRISDAIFLAAGIHPLMVFESNNNLIIANMIRQGAGIGFLPRSQVNPQDPELAFFSLNPGVYINLGIILKKGTILSEPVSYLAYLLFRQNPREDFYIPSRNSTAEAILRKYADE